MKLKKLAAGLVAMAVLFVGGGTSVEAADVKSKSYSLYYNSPASYYTGETFNLTYYPKTYYFYVGSISGGASAITVSCRGNDAYLSGAGADNTYDITRAGMQQSFTCDRLDESKTTVQFKVSLSNGDTYSTAYASGKVYVN